VFLVNLDCAQVLLERPLERIEEKDLAEGWGRI
jgi:hypothetical protein